ncbi:MAG: DUF4168 domain-containing protein [Salinibacter sp.]
MLMSKRSITSFCLGLVALAFTATAAMGQMPQPNKNLLSASDVSQEEIRKAARIFVSVRGPLQKQRMKLRRDMKKKYGKPQQMDSTQKAKAKREMRRRQMKMRKKQMRLIRKTAKKEGMKPKRFRKIMQSAQKDSTLQKKFQAALKAEMKKKKKSMGGGQNPNQ